MSSGCADSALRWTTLLWWLSLAGCAAVGPDYVPPRAAAPAAWHADLQGGLNAHATDPQMLAQWWKTLNDPVLTQLITQAIAGNRDLVVAQANIRAARASRGIAASALYPTLDANASATRNHSNAQIGSAGARDLYTANFDAQWELDVFGGTRRAVEAADADVEASEEQLHDVLVSLLAEVALNYVDVRSLQQQIAVAQQNLTTRSESSDISNWRYQAGLGTALDVEQARYALEQSRAQLPTLRTSLAQAMNQIAVLTGRPPGAVEALLATPAPVPVTPLSLAVGVPADVLRQRPDVRRAERQLAAQTARVGVATAAQYPNFSLLGSIGWEALSAGDLFTPAVRGTTIGANLAQPIFNAGRIRQTIAVQNALQEQALATYESTLLTALQDVEDALVAYAQEQQSRDALRAGAQAAQNAATLALDQYTSGLVDFQVVLETQRALLLLQEQLVISSGQVTADLIRIYKALGGGWTPLRASGQNAATRRGGS
jgi:NodT family efflux transporter outer membrane factor (OMF) lipoprotein